MKEKRTAALGYSTNARITPDNDSASGIGDSPAMQAIVTTLKLARPLDDEILHKVEHEFFPRAREANAGFLGAKVVRVSDLEVVLLAFYSNREALDDVSSKIAGPWFAENVRPYLACPVSRNVGEVIVDVSY